MATSTKRGSSRKGATREPRTGYWIRAIGPGSHVDYEEIYVYGPTRRSDEGVVGHDLRVRPTRLGDGDYTMVVAPDAVVWEKPGEQPPPTTIAGRRQITTSGEPYLSTGYVSSRRRIEEEVAAVVHEEDQGGRQAQASAAGRWEEDRSGGHRFVIFVDDVRFDTAGVDPTYYRDAGWRQRWEFDLRREIEKHKAGRSTKLYKMSEVHYRLPATI